MRLAWATDIHLDHASEAARRKFCLGVKDQADALVVTGGIAGSHNGGWIPLVGDWDGDGKTGVGLYDPAASGFSLTNALSTGIAQYTFGYGAPNGGWQTMVGDWNGDGKTGVGLYDPHGSMFYLTNAFTTGYAENSFGYGVPNGGWKPIVGDWNADGATGVGLYCPTDSTFYLTNTLTTGMAEIAFRYGTGNGGWIPLVGTWQASHLLAADGGRSLVGDAEPLSAADLGPIVAAARTRWADTGLSGQALAEMSEASVQVADLCGGQLGETVGDTIYVDRTAAGHGWFVDPTPARDEEFARLGTENELHAVDPQAVDHIDLLTVVEHELGHLAGLDDLDASRDSLMSGQLAPGIRRSPGAAEIDALFADPMARA